MNIQRLLVLLLIITIVPIVVLVRYSDLRLLVDATFLEGMFLALLGSTLSVASLLSTRARPLRKIGLEILMLGAVTILVTLIIGMSFASIR